MSLRFGLGVVSAENIFPTPNPIPLPGKKEVSKPVLFWQAVHHRG